MWKTDQATVLKETKYSTYFNKNLNCGRDGSTEYKRDLDWLFSIRRKLQISQIFEPQIEQQTSK